MTVPSAAAETAAAPRARTLDPRVVRLWRTSTAIWTLAIAGGCGIGELVWPDVAPFWEASVAMLIYGIFSFAVWAPLRYRSWSFEIRPSDVYLEHGVLWKRAIVVPHARIQHVDSRQGPIARRFGLASVVLHTAGHVGAAIEIPGLPSDEAENLRERLGALSAADDAV